MQAWACLRPEPANNGCDCSPEHELIIDTSIEHLQTSGLLTVPSKCLVRLHVVHRETGQYLSRHAPHVAHVADDAPAPLLGAQEQQEMLRQPGHATMVTVYQKESAGVAALAHVPATQTRVSVQTADLLCCLSH